MTPPAEFSSLTGSPVNLVLPNGAPALEHAEMRKRTYHAHANLDTTGLEIVHGGAASRLPNSEEHRMIFLSASPLLLICFQNFQ